MAKLLFMDNGRAHSQSVRVVSFNRPFNVTLEIESSHDSPSRPDSHDNEILVETSFSAVSPGTELLAFTGQMPKDIATDSKFSNQQNSFSYPARYGYACVGVVKHNQTGSGPATGTTVFAFREHISSFRASPQSLHQVPYGIEPIDATFLPTVETALSLASDAALLPGDTVCVVGQGIIGLVLVNVLRRLHPYSTIVALDILPERLVVSKRNADSHAALDPSSPDFRLVFSEVLNGEKGVDVSIDVSGVGQGLDIAISCTRDYGRVIIGSWFGNKTVSLTSLGGRFHRSHIQLIASQVSDIPTSLTPRWSKQRRFNLAWQLIRDMKPASRFPVDRMRPDDAQQAYNSLSKGAILHAIFHWES